MARFSSLSRLTTTVLASAALVTALMSLSACKDDKPADVPGAPAAEAGAADGPAAKAGAEAAKAGAVVAPPVARIALELPATPEFVLGVFGSSSYKDAVNALVKTGETVAPDQLPPDLASMGLEGLKQAFGLKDVSWMKTDAPIRAVVVDPKTFPGGVAIVLPATSKDAVLAALPEGANQAVEGHGASFDFSGDTLYLDFVDGHVVIARDEALFAKVGDFVKGPVVGWKPLAPAAVVGHMINISRVFATEIAGAKSELLEMQKAANSGILGDDSDAMSAAQVDMIFALIEGTQTLEFNLSIAGDAMRLDTAIFGKGEGTLTKLAGLSKGKTPTMNELLPTTTWFGMATDLDMREIPFLKEMQDAAVTTWAGFLELTPEDTRALKSMIDRSMKVSTGRSAQALYTEGAFPMAMVSVMDSTDGKEAKAIYDDMLAFVFAKSKNMFGEALKAEGTELDLESMKNFTDALTALNVVAGPHGVKAAMLKNEADGVSFEGVVIDVDYDKAGVKEGDPEVYAILDGVVGKHLEMVLGIKGNQIAMAIGPKAVEAAKNALSGTKAGGEANLNAAAKRYAMAISMRLGAAIEAFAFVPELAAMKAKVDALPKDSAVVIGMGSVDGKILDVRTELPLKLLKGLAAFAD